MNASFRECLIRMQEAESVAAVAVVDTDGMVVASVPEESEDLESLAASMSGLLSYVGALGTDAGLGEMQQSMLEFRDGILFVGPLNEVAFLVVVAESGSPLGQVRLVLRRYRDELIRHLEAV